MIDYTDGLDTLYSLEKPVWQFIKHFDTSIVSATDNMMCTSVCPCFLNQATYNYYRGQSEYTHNMHNRTTSFEQKG